MEDEPKYGPRDVHAEDYDETGKRVGVATAIEISEARYNAKRKSDFDRFIDACDDGTVATNGERVRSEQPLSPAGEDGELRRSYAEFKRRDYGGSIRRQRTVEPDQSTPASPIGSHGADNSASAEDDPVRVYQQALRERDDRARLTEAGADVELKELALSVRALTASLEKRGDVATGAVLKKVTGHIWRIHGRFDMLEKRVEADITRISRRLLKLDGDKDPDQPGIGGIVGFNYSITSKPSIQAIAKRDGWKARGQN